jgi:carboxypeptidase Taq
MKHSLYFEALRPYLERRDRLSHLTAVLYYDIATSAPEKTIDDENELMNHYDSERVSISQEVAYKSLVKKGLADPNASPMEKRLFHLLYDEISLMDKLSLSDYTKAKNAFTKSNEMWRICRPKNDFAGYLPYWKECVKWARVVAKARMKEGTKTPYDADLDAFEPGESSAYLDAIFAPIKKTIINLLPLVISRQDSHPLPSINPYGYGAQCQLAYDLLNNMHYDMKGGCLKTSAHPFSTDIYRHDARLTTKYLVEDFRSNLFTIMHEGGHCLEFQNKSEEEYDSFLQSASTAAICETHSRFYENLIGRSEEFAPYLKKMAIKDLDPGFAFMSDADFYALLNRVEPGLIRCEADELTYTLHIIVRYEIERDLINEKIECEDVPALWKAKYKSYLGIDVPNDKDGCLQDVHWSDAEFGYFPSYALGNIYGAMIRETMDEEIHFTDLVRENKLDVILDWLTKRDFANDWMEPGDWIKKITGKELTSAPYITYLTNKYGENAGK